MENYLREREGRNDQITWQEGNAQQLTPRSDFASMLFNFSQRKILFHILSELKLKVIARHHEESDG